MLKQGLCRILTLILSDLNFHNVEKTHPKYVERFTYAFPEIQKYFIFKLNHSPQRRIFQVGSQQDILLTIDLDLRLNHLMVGSDLEKLWDVKDDRKEDDKALVKLDVLL